MRDWRQVWLAKLAILPLTLPSPASGRGIEYALFLRNTIKKNFIAESEWKV